MLSLVHMTFLWKRIGCYKIHVGYLKPQNCKSFTHMGHNIKYIMNVVDCIRETKCVVPSVIGLLLHGFRIAFDFDDFDNILKSPMKSWVSFCIWELKSIIPCSVPCVTGMPIDSKRPQMYTSSMENNRCIHIFCEYGAMLCLAIIGQNKEFTMEIMDHLCTGQRGDFH